MTEKTSCQFWFIVPLKAKAISANWSVVCANLRATIKSVLNQTDSRFNIIVSGSDHPDLGDIDDNRLTVLIDDYEVPLSFLDKAMDKRAKKRAAASYIRSNTAGGCYVMLLDADDLISRNLVEYVLADDNREGYLIEDGYLLFSKTNIVEKVSAFWSRCGSCYICYFLADQLPKSPSDTDTFFEEYRNHRLAASVAQSQGKFFVNIPFPAAIYRLETGENLSNHHPNRRIFSRHGFIRLARAVGRSLTSVKTIQNNVAEEFGLKPHPKQ